MQDATLQIHTPFQIAKSHKYKRLGYTFILNARRMGKALLALQASELEQITSQVDKAIQQSNRGYMIKKGHKLYDL